MVRWIIKQLIAALFDMAHNILLKLNAHRLIYYCIIMQI